MRLVVQRVTRAEVGVAGRLVSKIGRGLCVFVGVGRTDGDRIADHLAEKIKNLRIFEDDQGKMNRSVSEIGGEVLLVSQFTLYGDCRKGNRPSFSDAAPVADAERLYQHLVASLKEKGLRVCTGEFQAKMEISLTNDGPATFVLES